MYVELTKKAIVVITRCADATGKHAMALSVMRTMKRRVVSRYERYE
jgi:polyphosphate kinase 2 (PPK2 family)